ncbi:MAG: PAS domain-containing protein [Alphaproteobacteria bacterium]|nr:PAS domain-containing protein [Alphaproteobacteria bacterium]
MAEGDGIATGPRVLADVLVEASPNGVLVADQEGRLVRANPAAFRLLPMADDPAGMALADAIAVPLIVDALGPGREDRFEAVIALDERELLVRALSFSLEGRRGRLALVEDVTRLRQAERYRSEFVANVSHELRTPATAIAGYAETLLDDGEALDPGVHRMVEVIHRNARRLTELFDDLLHLSRIDAREGPLPVSGVLLEPVVQSCLDKVAAPAAEKELTLQSFGLAGVRVQGNREALGHVIGNLLENAVKYSMEGGVVTVGARRRDGGWRIEVIDVGIGIAPAHHDRIFERFYRVDKGRARAAGGTGLGLAIVKRLCDKMGAQVSVRSQVGRGSVFRVWLPEGVAGGEEEPGEEESGEEEAGD